MKREIWSVWKKGKREIKVRNEGKNIEKLKKRKWECIGWSIRERWEELNRVAKIKEV